MQFYLPNPFDYILVTIFGLLLGSFANVLILRLPKNENWTTARSKCPHCQKQLRWWMNIPLLSFVLLNAKCYYCKGKISSQYMIIELIVGAAALIHYIYFAHHLQLALLHILMFFLLTAHMVIDLKHRLLPDIINAALLLLGLWHVHLTPITWSDALLGAAFAFISTFAITYGFYLLKGQIGLGGGDIKLYTIIGVFLGLQGVIQTLLYSSLLGIVLALILMSFKKMTKNDPMPFGPAIIIIFFAQLHFSNLFPQL